MKRYLTFQDIHKFSVKKNDISASFLTSKTQLADYINIKDKRYYIYRLSDLKYIITDVNDDTFNDIPKMFTKFQTYNFDELIEYIRKDYKSLDEKSSFDIEEYIKNLKIANYEYKADVFSKITKQYAITVYSKVIDNTMSYLLSVECRNSYNTVNDGQVYLDMLTTEYEFESCDVDTIIEKFNETYSKYALLDTSDLTWTSILESVTYNDLLELSSLEINKKHLFYIETFEKYFGNLNDKNKINIFINNVWSYKYAYGHIMMTPEFFKTISYDSNIETGECAKYFDLYVKHISDDDDDDDNDVTHRLWLRDATPLKDDDLVLYLTI